MNTAAILNSVGLVTNIVVADHQEIPGAVDGAGGAIGDTWDGVRFIRAGQSPLPLQFPQFVGNEKLDLFTPQEQMAVVTATMTDPMVKLMYDRLLGAAYLSYEDPETEQGLALLVDKGLLTPERKAEVVQQMLPR